MNNNIGWIKKDNVNSGNGNSLGNNMLKLNMSLDEFNSWAGDNAETSNEKVIKLFNDVVARYTAGFMNLTPVLMPDGTIANAVYKTADDTVHLSSIFVADGKLYAYEIELERLENGNIFCYFMFIYNLIDNQPQQPEE